MSQSPTPILRPARATDAPGIQAIWNPIIAHTTITFTTEPKSQAGLEAWIAQSPVWVAEAEGDVLGFCAYGPFRGGPGYAHVAETTVFVADGAKGRGLGHALMRHLETAARADGKSVLVAGISGENPAALGFHA
ncbi:MAG: N-acetyltransferase family protein, partial [Pseudomonadota bacterium]